MVFMPSALEIFLRYDAYSRASSRVPLQAFIPRRRYLVLVSRVNRYKIRHALVADFER